MAHNIILIDHEPFTIRRKELFYIEALIAHGFYVEVWSISKWFYPEMHIVDTIHEEYVYNINSVGDLYTHLNSTVIGDTVFIVESFWNWHTRKLFRILSDYNCITIRMDLYANSTLAEPLISKIQRLVSPLIFRIIRGKMERLILTLYNILYQINGYAYYLSSSAIVNRTHAINHPDYEKYKFSNTEPIISGNYVVFCDIFFPFHPDIKNFARYHHEIDGNEYQRKLRLFFDYIEARYNMPVIIAAHPKADYKGNEFGGRRIIKYSTDNLVQYSSMVLMHQCNSISYSILNGKPIILFSTDEYESNKRWKYSLKSLADNLDLKVYNIDHVRYNQIIAKCVEEDLARRYVYTYLTSNATSESRNIDTLINIISKI